MKGLSLEVRVGLLVLVALVLLGGFVFILGGVELGDQYDLYVDFDNPGNVQPGAPVNVGSIQIGTVEGVEYWGGRLDPQTGRRPLIRTHLRVDENVRETIHEDAMFYVTSQSVLGESIIAVDPGDPERPALEDGAIVQGVDPPRLDLALALAYDLLENLSKLLRDNREELGTLLRSAANMIRQMDELLQENDNRLDAILANLERATEQTNEVLDGANGIVNGQRLQRTLRNVDRTLASVSRDIDPILEDVRGITEQGNEALGAIGPEQQDEIRTAIHEASSLAEEANATIADARAIVSHIREGRGTVGAFVMDEEIYDDIQEMLRDLKHNPWKLFWRE
ncbi:MAG TPA: MlaD family protein [Polyangiaceae bacterium LLY-WYZ-15_(1-7)]|nr:organic solvent ABC transporter substrate-binding protein [Myxococcales bacterium]MAT23516.1 organic solvent ABC transporter substrate-binding protein [Sandaracinus sp.]HJK95107.1 MlaD family protein [Polyangiaceae bacterium LLY-WYZ-15_(1-7)]MBJ73782.1 organic solvent ABC transporter substrate-binding protein [Sandaracinus sp.]HJL02622.1 MlaD family protein [Polyangiaceae bacterium LLY-WYZ-15_(1-7)]